MPEGRLAESTSSGIYRLYPLPPPPSNARADRCVQICLCIGKDIVALEMKFDPARRQWNLSGGRVCSAMAISAIVEIILLLHSTHPSM